MTEHAIRGAPGTSADISTQTGDELVVYLPENPSTGYQWGLASYDTQLVEPAGDTYQPAGPPRPGTGGTRVLRLRAAAAGQTVIVIRLRRGRSSPAAAAQEFTLKVSIRDPGP
jgi:inhibitor of cysteine peptidase